jgi:cytochrome c oxidase assembly protein subunit 15
MALSNRSARTTAYKPALATFAAVAGAWVFVLVTLGAFTTSIDAGMAFPDWPLSNGSLNPHGWLTSLPMFSEHAHRLSAGLMTILSLLLAIWIWFTEERSWLRKLAIFAVALCVFQAIVGGLRVLLEPEKVAPLGTSVGQLFAMLHACLGQGLACTLIALAIACSRSWQERAVPVSPGLQRWGVLCCELLFVQLAIAAIMRHSFAGLAIPTFPWSNAAGGLFPPVWTFKVAIHFAHRVMALVLTVALVVFAIKVWTDRGAPLGMRMGASVLVSLLALQILLGAAVIRTFRDPLVTTAHVLVGALTLATTFWMTWLAHRDAMEGVRP